MKATALASRRTFSKVVTSRTWTRVGSTVLGGGLAVLLGVGGSMGMMGCGAEQEAGDVTAATSEALIATISGTIADAQGRPLSGVQVVMAGRLMATQTTGGSGTYSFPINVPGATASFSIQPSRTGCAFNPTVANLNSINGSRTANFTGSGANCVGVAQNPTINATDPGPRGGPAAAGDPVAGLSAAEQALFLAAQDQFNELESVSGTATDEPGRGLGPTFNGNSCQMCHSQPASGGTSPGLQSPQNPVPNPQIALATLDGALNTIPSFISATSPTREARFPIAGGGGVAGLFTIRGRSDAPGCNLTQPNFAAQVASGDIIFRIATPVFGLGLIENTSDLALQASLTANLTQKAAQGLSGRFNTSGNDGTITRFGWKAQNKSLQIFAGEAYNVENGVSNDNFPNERSAVAGCVFNTTPEDVTNADDLGGGLPSDATLFALFMRLLAPPTPAPATASTTNGSNVFTAVGCANCHQPTLTTTTSPTAALNNVTYSPFSDIALHNMGALADRVPQGGAASDEFRTAPLWGVGQRLFFLHDGRTANIVAAIQAHFSTGSEGNTSVTNLAARSATDQQDLVNFLRSL